MESLEGLRGILNDYSIEIVLGLIVGYLILFIFVLISQNKTKKARIKYNQLVQGMDGKNIEEILFQAQKNISKIDREIHSIEKNIKDVEMQLSFAIGKVGFMRYNAFDDMGSELSFSIALLDDYKNGFVISSIYGRENTVSYGKEIKNGESKIPLSTEEMLVIDRAIKGNHAS